MTGVPAVGTHRHDASSWLPTAVTLENDRLRADFLPARGAKLASLVDRHSGRHWLLSSQRPDRSDPQCRPGDDFLQSDTSGLDECFPNVAPGAHAGVAWPDHGELWSRPWACVADARQVECVLRGAAWPYVFSRRATLEAATLRFDYELVNEAVRPFDCLWSLHPLFAVRPDTRINLPGEVRDVLVASSNLPGLAAGERRPWPEVLAGESLAHVPGHERGLAVKLFTDALRHGCCELRQGAEALRVEWDVHAAPYLGLWLCYGGWPDDGRPGHLTVGLEPCSGRPDSLAEARQHGECWTLPPGGARRWWVRLTCTS